MKKKEHSLMTEAEGILVEPEKSDSFVKPLKWFSCDLTSIEQQNLAYYTMLLCIWRLSQSAKK